jgi:hypothetical protein
MNRSAALLATSVFALMLPTLASAGSPYDAMIAQHAAANGVPIELVHRVIVRESRYNPRAVNSGNYGMMQIRLQTARGMGYTGTAQGLLDPNTNLTYAVKYLAGAYHVAGGNHGRAVSLYASGYYYAAKRRGMTASAPAPVFASLSVPGQPANFGAGPVVPTPMTDTGAPPPVLQPGTTEANRAFRAAKAADAARSASAARSAAAANGAAFTFTNPFKDQSKPRSAKAASSNPFASMFKQEPPRRGRS